MNRTTITVATLGFLAGAALLAATARLKSSGASESRTVAVQSQSNPQEQATTFTGTIAQHGERFVLKDDGGKTWYDLDDQTSAKKFAGKRVRVTGTLDASNNTIRVRAIEGATA
jgi:uncharacterized protein YdeI (BOF family)